MGNETLAQRGFTRCKAPLLMTATVLSRRSRQCLLCSCESSEVKDHLRRLIGEVPTILRYMDAALRQEREVLCLFGCKGKHFLSMKPTFLATKSSRISNPVVSGRKLADFLSLLPLFLRRAPSLSLCAPPFVPVLFARFTHSPRSLSHVGTFALTPAPAHCALSDFPFFCLHPSPLSA